MRRLLAVPFAAAVLAVLPAGTSHAYTRECGGHVDTRCSGWVCPTDCWQRDCLLWIDALHNSMTALCFGDPLDL